jgi:hypothetical protein
MARRQIHGLSALAAPLVILFFVVACSPAPAPTGGSGPVPTAGSSTGSADATAVAGASTILTATHLDEPASMAAPRCPAA